MRLISPKIYGNTFTVFSKFYYIQQPFLSTAASPVLNRDYRRHRVSFSEQSNGVASGEVAQNLVCIQLGH